MLMKEKVSGYQSKTRLLPFSGIGMGFGFGVGCGVGVGYGMGGAGTLINSILHIYLISHL